MLVRVIQRFPNFIEGQTAQEADVNSVEDLINIPFVQRWMNEPTFYRLCKSTVDKSDRHYLMVETNKGNKYWAIAYMTGDVDNLALPEWKKTT